MLEIMGVPFDLCGKRPGARLGPEAIRLAGLKESLAPLVESVHDHGDVAVGSALERGGLKNFDAALLTYKNLKQAVQGSMQSGHTPLVIGGDHSLAIASVAAALERHGDELAVLWIDAHLDLNTPDTSPTGNLHGMPLAALLGLGASVDGLVAQQWGRLLKEIVPAKRLQASQIAWIGLRDVDPGEVRHLQNLGGSLSLSMQEVDRLQISGIVAVFDQWIRASGAKKLWISFDVDVLDPVFAPGTGTAVRGGLTYREGHLLAELLCQAMREKNCPYELAGVDVVEVNPLCDNHNETALIAVEWLASLFGKTILSFDRELVR